MVMVSITNQTRRDRVMSVKMAIAYLESFIELDMGKDHHCSVCGTNSCNQIDYREVEKALEELRITSNKTGE